MSAFELAMNNAPMVGARLIAAIVPQTPYEASQKFYALVWIEGHYPDKYWDNAEFAAIRLAALRQKRAMHAYPELQTILEFVTPVVTDKVTLGLIPRIQEALEGGVSETQLQQISDQAWRICDYYWQVYADSNLPDRAAARALQEVITGLRSKNEVEFQRANQNGRDAALVALYSHVKKETDNS